MEGLSEALTFDIRELQKTHSGLTRIQRGIGEMYLSGSLPFDAHHDELEAISACFNIELRIPESYPENLPIVRETGGAIKETYEHVNPDGTLCLCVPIKARIVFHNDPTLLGFVNKLVVPFLYGYSYWEKHNVHPFGEQEHGSAGIVQFYMDTFDLRGEKEVVEVVRSLNEYGYDGHRSCPCGSGRLVKKCHGKILRELHHRHTPQTLQHDWAQIARRFYAEQPTRQRS